MKASSGKMPGLTAYKKRVKLVKNVMLARPGASGKRYLKPINGLKSWNETDKEERVQALKLFFKHKTRRRGQPSLLSAAQKETLAVFLDYCEEFDYNVTLSFMHTIIRDLLRTSGHDEGKTEKQFTTMVKNQGNSFRRSDLHHHEWGTKKVIC